MQSCNVLLRKYDDLENTWKRKRKKTHKQNKSTGKIFTLSVIFLFSPPPSDLFQTKGSRALITRRDGTGRFSLRRIPSVWTSSWSKPSSTAALRGPPTAAAQRTTTTIRNAGRSEHKRAQSPCRAAASVLEDGEVVCTLSVVVGCF